MCKVYRTRLDALQQHLAFQVVDLTGREGRVLEGCLNKDRQIDAQYSALAGLNNLTVLQVFGFVLLGLYLKQDNCIEQNMSGHT